MLDDLREWLVCEPFVAFRVVLSSGDYYEVRSPLQLFIIGTRLAYFFSKSDRRAIADVFQVAAIETLEDNEPR